MNGRDLGGLLTDSKDDDEFLIPPELLLNFSILPMEELPDGVAFDTVFGDMSLSSEMNTLLWL